MLCFPIFFPCYWNSLFPCFWDNATDMKADKNILSFISFPLKLLCETFSKEDILSYCWSRSSKRILGPFAIEVWRYINSTEEQTVSVTAVL